jgi:hypothetical protein
MDRSTGYYMSQSDLGVPFNASPSGVSTSVCLASSALESEPVIQGYKESRSTRVSATAGGRPEAASRKTEWDTLACMQGAREGSQERAVDL